MLCAVRRHVAYAPQFRCLSSTPATCAAAGTELLRLQSLDTPADHKAAREWVDGFGVGDIPKEALAVSYSRSSGPGGQVSHTAGL
jgi:peptidyl-tRNA hydrolase ICT1